MTSTFVPGHGRVAPSCILPSVPGGAPRPASEHDVAPQAGAPQDRAPFSAARPSRRRLLGASLLGGLAWNGASRSASASVSVSDTPFLRMLWRTCQGFDLEYYQRAWSLGWDGYLNWQLDPAAIPDAQSDAWLAQFPSLTMSAKQLYDTYNASQGQMKNELRWATILRSVYSWRSLFERSVEFWTDHFNQDQDDGNVGYFKTVDDRDVIRAHALGTFPDLLWASMHSPSMLHYLDNYNNKVSGPQENYARELLELHTMGVGSGYTEMDVKEVARCLTGWRYVTSTSDPAWGTFLFQSNLHDQGAKTVLGVPIPSGGGINDGQIVHQILSSHPSTAKHIASKLCRWFLVDAPPAALVDEVAQIYTQTGGSIQLMLRHILRTQSFELALPASNPKLKRPFSFGVGLLRALRARVTSTTSLHTHFKNMGQEPFDWPAPNGYPDSVGAWGSSLLPRWNFATKLLDGALSGLALDQTYIEQVWLGGAALPSAELPERIDLMLTGGILSASDLEIVRRFILRAANVNWTVKREAIALAASLSSYQLY